MRVIDWRAMRNDLVYAYRGEVTLGDQLVGHTHVLQDAEAHVLVEIGLFVPVVLDPDRGRATDGRGQEHAEAGKCDESGHEVFSPG